MQNAKCKMQISEKIFDFWIIKKWNYIGKKSIE